MHSARASVFSRLWFAVLVAIVWVAELASAVIIDSGDGTGNTEAPPDDPGWHNVASLGSRSAVYLGNHWVITALHVGAGHVKIDGEPYPMLPKSEVIVTNDDGANTDLVLFQIDPEPPVPRLRISESTPTGGTALVMIGRGLSRGETLRFGGFSGFRWGARAPMRWGTSEVALQLAFGRVSDTATFAARFTIAGSEHEAIAARGDSGGAAFVHSAGGWELAGIMLAVGSYGGQPAKTAMYGNQTYIADLSVYRDQIQRIMQRVGLAVSATEPEAGD
jgi:hypothetical protein